ncbi:hypothetical protein C8K15_12918 [Paenisporosarcina sp. OV554]|nr:hypothetical protein C8K15_12918 [Paenisporosarcina sp. OV554]
MEYPEGNVTEYIFDTKNTKTPADFRVLGNLGY